MAKPKFTAGKKDQTILPGLHNFFPRSYQLNPLEQLDSGIKRAVLVWHRRAGKDKTALNFTIKEMMRRVGVYYHLFPTYGQGKRTIWDGIGSDGKPFLSHFPEEIIKAKNETEMQIQTKNGSIWQVVGTDRNLDNLVGPNPVGCVFSEYSIQDPRAWTLLRPILRENGGWAVFIYTPRGQNHGWDLYQMAKDNPEWYCELKTIKDTVRDAPGENGGPVLTQEDIEAERREGMSDDMIDQEYYCSFQGSLAGAYYLKEINDADRAGRIKSVPWNPTQPVYTWWDLGYDDSTTIWFLQVNGNQYGFIDYEEDSQKGLPYYAKLLTEKPYTYGEHILPHDVEVHDYGSGRTRFQMAEDLGIRPIIVAPKWRIHEGINAARSILPRCFFDKDKCARGLDALRNYKKDWDEVRKVYKDQPNHDWACFTGETLVLTRHGMYQIRDLPESGEVLTPCGWKQYHSPRLARQNARLVEVTFGDGFTVKCTPDHLFLTDNGWRSAESLTTNSLIQSCSIRSLNTSMADCIGFGQKKDTIRAAASPYIARRGGLLSAKYQRAVTSITEMMIRPIMLFQISNACLRASTYLTLGIIPEQIQQSISVLPHVKEQPNGIAPKPDACGIVGMPDGKRHGPSGSANLSRARDAALSLMRLFVKAVTRKNSAPKFAKPLAIESVKPLPERADVWDITVPDGEWFCLSNGAVVHNSHGADAFRTGAVGFDGGQGYNDSQDDIKMVSNMQHGI